MSMGLYQRTPGKWRSLDTDSVLQKFLSVGDDGFDRAKTNIEGLYALRSVDEIPDRWLELLGASVGHAWRSDKTRAWNRSAIGRALKQASYKGTSESLDDLIREHGGEWHEVVDIASRLDIWNRQGGWNRRDGVVMDGNFWHDGSYRLEVDSKLDFVSFQQDFERIQRAGTVWFYIVYTESGLTTAGVAPSTDLTVEAVSAAWDWQLDRWYPYGPFLVSEWESPELYPVWLGMIPITEWAVLISYPIYIYHDGGEGLLWMSFLDWLYDGWYPLGPFVAPEWKLSQLYPIWLGLIPVTEWRNSISYVMAEHQGGGADVFWLLFLGGAYG